MQHRMDWKGYHGSQLPTSLITPGMISACVGDQSPSLPAGVIFRERTGLLQELGRQGELARRCRLQDDLSHDCVDP